MPAKVRPVADMLAELEETLSTVTVAESRIVSATHFLDGYYDYGTHTVHIDPRYALTDVLLHELLHARYPSWSERRVSREGRRLMTSLTERQLRRWVRLYQKARTVRKTPVRYED